MSVRSDQIPTAAAGSVIGAMTGLGEVHVILPDSVDDPASPSGGNVYDRQVCRGLAAIGWSVREHRVRGSWSSPGDDARGVWSGSPDGARSDLDALVSGVPDGATVLVDGLVAVAAPAVLSAHAGRLRVVVLAHMPFGDADQRLAGAERASLAAAVAIVTTSRWCRRRLINRYGVTPTMVHVATPGVDRVDPAAVAIPSAAGTRLLCVAALAPHKGHDLVIRALAGLTDAAWTCACVGPDHREPEYPAQLRRSALPLAGRLTFLGPRTGADLDHCYAEADLLVLASRQESYGMVVAEALARAVPVLATAVGGVPEALGTAPDGGVPGILVPPGDPVALRQALSRWLASRSLRRELRRHALARRDNLTGWTGPVTVIANVLAEVAEQGRTPK